MASAYVFRPMTTADLTLIRRWLGLPHVRKWWGDPDEQYALVSGDLDEPAMDQYIVSTGGNDLATCSATTRRRGIPALEINPKAHAASICSSANPT